MGRQTQRRRRRLTAQRTATRAGGLTGARRIGFAPKGSGNGGNQAYLCPEPLTLDAFCLRLSDTESIASPKVFLICFVFTEPKCALFTRMSGAPKKDALLFPALR